MFLGTLGPGLLGIFLTGKGVIATSQGQGIYWSRKGKGKNRAGYGRPLSSASQNNKMDF